MSISGRNPSRMQVRAGMQHGSSLIEAVVALLLLSSMTAAAAGILRSTRAAAIHTERVTVAAVLADHLATVRSLGVQGASQLVPSRRGRFDPPFEDYEWDLSESGRFTLLTVRSDAAGVTILVR